MAPVGHNGHYDNGWESLAEVERAGGCDDPRCTDPNCTGGHPPLSPIYSYDFAPGSEVPGLQAAAEALARGFTHKQGRGRAPQVQQVAGGGISLEDWARRSDNRGAQGLSSASYYRSTQQRGRNGPVGYCSGAIAPPPEIDASLQDLLAPLVAERVHDLGQIAPPSSLEVRNVFAAISAVSAPALSPDGSSEGSHFSSACRSLARSGFRRCCLVVDKLGVSVRCVEEREMGQQEEQVDFPWSSISDVQDPRLKAGLQGCAVTLGVREPTRLFEAASGALALVLRLPDRDTARRLADAALAFKAYEAQTALWNACSQAGLGTISAPFGKFATLLLDERGCAFWSLVGDEEAAYLEAAKTHVEPLGPVVEVSVPESSCCNLCWC
mmetsp:Transcript_153905/g.271737  ORF Transcript_153905/g.271737 Transcript_153905/m.271737 type:complete len:382 (+) Transcript_153905:101-1246(+)